MSSSGDALTLVVSRGCAVLGTNGTLGQGSRAPGLIFLGGPVQSQDLGIPFFDPFLLRTFGVPRCHAALLKLPTKLELPNPCTLPTEMPSLCLQTLT